MNSLYWKWFSTGVNLRCRTFPVESLRLAPAGLDEHHPAPCHPDDRKAGYMKDDKWEDSNPIDPVSFTPRIGLQSRFRINPSANPFLDRGYI